VRGILRPALAGLLLLLPGGAARAELPPLDRVLASLEEASRGVDSVSARFIQERSLAAFKRVLVSHGRFAFKRPRLLRWETTDPVAAGFVVNGSGGRRWNETTGQREEFSGDDPLANAVAAQVMAWATADFSLLREQYEIALLAEEPVALRLVPRSAKARRFIEAMEVSFAPDRRSVRQVTMREGGGDRTTITFSGVEVNPTLAEGLF